MKFEREAVDTAKEIVAPRAGGRGLKFEQENAEGNFTTSPPAQGGVD